MTKLPGGKIGGPRREAQFHSHATIVGKRGQEGAHYWVCNNGYMTEKFAVRSVAFSEEDGKLTVRPVTSVRQKPEDPTNKHCTSQNVELGDFVFEYVRRNTKQERSVYSVREDGPTGDLILAKLTTSQEVELFNRLECASSLAYDFLEDTYESYDALADDKSSNLPDGLGWTGGMTEHMKSKISRVKTFIRGITDAALREKIIEYAKFTPAKAMPTRWSVAPYIEMGAAMPVGGESVYIIYQIDGGVKKLNMAGWEPTPLPADTLSVLQIDFMDQAGQKTLKWQLHRVKGANHLSPKKHLTSHPSSRGKRNTERRHSSVRDNP